MYCFQRSAFLYGITLALEEEGKGERRGGDWRYERGEGKEGEEFKRERDSLKNCAVLTSSSPMSSMLPLTIGMSISSI